MVLNLFHACAFPSVAVALSIDDISNFGDSSRELFVKGSCYSLISIAVGDRGPSIGWVFSSDPKSISFCVVYREGPDMPVEQAKVSLWVCGASQHENKGVAVKRCRSCKRKQTESQ